LNEINKVLQGIVRGAGIVFAGTIISMLFWFLNAVVVARFFSTAEYGVFNLALTILNIAFIITMLGFPSSLPREVAFYREKEPSKIGSLILTALVIVSLISLAVTSFLVFGSTYIARIFNENRLSYALKIISLALPFSALIGTFVAISQGFGRVRERVYFQNIAFPLLLFTLIVFGIIVLKVPFIYVFVAYVIAQIITFSILVIDIFRLRLFELGSIDLKLGKELIRFSIPLMLTGIAGYVMTWTDTLMLGYFKTSEVVGLYNAAAPLARILPIFSNSAGFIYPSLITILYAQEKIEEIKKVYQVLTKWLFLVTLPLFTTLFLFPEVVIALFFGSEYLPASQALRILSLGFMFHALLGLNWWNLIVIKESKFIMYSTLISAILNVILNALLIPIYGIEGAAIATTLSYFVVNILNSLKLYQKISIHPFSKNYIKSLIISLVLLGLIQNLQLKVLSVWYAVPILIVFLIIYLFLILLSRSVDKEDIELILTLEKRTGINLKVIKKVLKKFI